MSGGHESAARQGGSSWVDQLRRAAVTGGIIVIISALLVAAPGSLRWLVVLVALVAAIAVQVVLRPHRGSQGQSGSQRRPQVRTAAWLGPAGALLPPAERACWRAVVVSVIDAEADRPARRRQARGFLLALPATVLTSWRIELGLGDSRRELR